MKGIILAGGLGTRLAPLTRNDNKHLLPVYNKRMIEYPIKTLVDAGIKDIILVTGGKRPGAFLELLKNGKDYNANRIYYTYQDGNGGISDALKLAEPFLEPGESCIVILGDNYFEDNIAKNIEEWNGSGASVFLKHVEDTSGFGIAEIQGNKIVSIEEKPVKPKSNLAILGLYMFDHNVWRYIKQIKPSIRAELEITDVLKIYMKDNNLSYTFYNKFWSDMGIFQTWVDVSIRMAKKDIKERQ
jgi:glucose-1-phosphate thymidylyltransferase